MADLKRYLFKSVFWLRKRLLVLSNKWSHWWFCRFSQPVIQGTHQRAPAACPFRQHRAAALAVRQRATLRQSQLAWREHPSGVHHVRDIRPSATVSTRLFDAFGIALHCFHWLHCLVFPATLSFPFLNSFYLFALCFCACLLYRLSHFALRGLFN